MSRHRVKAATASLLMGLLGLSSCGPLVKFGPSGPPPALARIELIGLSEPATPAVKITTPTILMIAMADAASEIRGDQPIVRSAPLTIEYLAGVRWAERPAPAMQRLIESLLRDQPGLTLLGPRQLDLPANYRLDGKLEAFEIDTSGARPVAIVTYDGAIAKLKPSRLSATKRFQARVAAADDSAPVLLDALNRAANQVANEVAVWTSTQLAGG